jgi:hypothetical protein
MSGAIDSPFLPRIGVPPEAVEGKSGETLVPMLRSAVRLEHAPGKCESVPLAAAFGVDDPPRELLQPRLDIELRELREVEHAQLRAQRGVFLHKQRRSPRVRFPGHLARRISFAERT